MFTHPPVFRQKSVFLATFVVISAVVVGTVLLLEPPASQAANCSIPSANITAQILADGRSDGTASARITNNSDCTYRVGFASYRINPNGQLERQTLHNYRTFNLGPHQIISPGSTGIAVPSDCQYQLDVFEGEPLVPPLYNGNNLLAYREVLDGRPWCGGTSTPPPTPSPTVVPSIPPPGPISAFCTGGTNPRVNLQWTLSANAVQNVIQKRFVDGSFTDLPQPLFSQAGPPFTQNSLVDTNVTLGRGYVYRYKPQATGTNLVIETTINLTPAACGVVNPTPSPTPTPTPALLTCSPSVQTTLSGSPVSFVASGGTTGIYLWSAQDGDPSLGSGTVFSTRFSSATSTTKTVTVQSGSQSANCLVQVLGVATPTPTPTPSPTPTTLTCNPSNATVSSGQTVNFFASGGPTNLYLWSAPGGDPQSGFSQSFTTRFFTNAFDETRTVAVDSGNQRATCTVRIFGGTFTPTPTPFQQLNIDKAVRNISTNSSESNSVNASPGDTVEFTIRVWNDTNSSIFNSRVIDTLPYGLRYLSGTTTVDGSSWSDGITSNGIYLNTLSPFRNVVIRFRAVVENDSFFSFGTNNLVNTARVSADNISSRDDSASVVVSRNQNVINQNNTLNINKLARNSSRGPAVEQSAVTAQVGDTVEFIIRVRSLSSTNLFNVVVTDALPLGLTFLPNTTSLNGILTNDLVSSSGINVGTLSPNQEAVVRFSARVDNFYGGALTNVATVRADNTPAVSASAPVTLGAILAPVTKVPTGPADSLALALLVGTLVTYCYAQYTGTSLFKRRSIQSLARQDQRNPDTLNFVRFLR